MQVITAIIFLVAYVLLCTTKQKRAPIGWSAALLLVVLGALTPLAALRSINLNVLGIFIGTAIIAELLIVSEVPAFFADHMVRGAGTVGTALIFVCILSGLLSMFLENVATVYIVAPVAFAIAKRLKTDPIPFIVGIAISANLEGTATLIGDPPSMLLAGYSGMDFVDFIVLNGRPGIFFAIQAGAVVGIVVLWLMFRKYRDPVPQVETTKVISWVPWWLLVGLVCALIASSLVPRIFLGSSPGTVSVIFGIIAFVWLYFKGGLNNLTPKSIIRKLDWDTLLFLASIFILVQSLINTGIVRTLSNFIGNISAHSPFLALSIILWISVFLSAFVDNVPFVTAMLPVAHGVATQIGCSPYLLYFGLLCGACIGGNITPIGAAANVAATGLLKREKSPVSFSGFAKIGLPFTLASVVASWIFIWLVWG